MKHTTYIALFSFILTTAIFAQTFVSGTVTGIWDTGGSPYYITDTVWVPDHDSLRIMPGVQVIFQGHYKFRVGSWGNTALLKAVGTPTDSIIFTAEDTVLTDSTGGHLSIRFEHSADGCSLAFCRVEFGNAFEDTGSFHNERGGGIVCYYSNVVIIDNAICKNSAMVFGGGIYCVGSDDAVMTGNTIWGNSAQSGGGISCRSSDATISDNIIFDNTANNGAGIGISSCDATVTGNTIFGNIAEYNGGGIDLQFWSPTVIDNIIYGNTARTGGGIHIYWTNPEVSRNVISGNHADDKGGGIYCGYSDPAIINNIISDNSTADDGGAIFCYKSDPTIVNNTMNGNTASDRGGGLFCERGSKPILFNNIFREDSATSAGNEIYIRLSSGEACTIFVAFNDIDAAGCDVGTDCEIIWGDGNFYTDPFFADTMFHLSDSSSCIDVGAESVYVALWDITLFAPDSDFDGNFRPLGTDWDIGAYEFDSTAVGIAEVRRCARPHALTISAFPNPFNSAVTITVEQTFLSVQNGQTGMSDLPIVEIFDIAGRCVAQLPVGGTVGAYRIRPKNGSTRLTPTNSEYVWTPDKSLGSGVYLVRAKIGDESVSKRIVYLK